jgi:hypothetical protein
MKGEQAGMILLVTLLMTSIMLLIALILLQSSAMDIALQHQHKDKMMVFAAAESGLIVAEALLSHMPVIFPATKVNVRYYFQSLGVDSAGNKLFQIHSIAYYHHVRIHLECQYLLNQSNKGVRLWWRQWV